MMRNSKRGSTIVFIMIIMATILSITFAFYSAARNEYVKSRGDGIINLSGDSVMSEYNSYVQKEYGLFLLEGKKSKLTSSLRGYVDYGLSGMEQVQVDSASASGASYSLTDISLVREQILTGMKYVAGMDMYKKIVGKPKEKNSMEYETLRNGPTIVSRPSYNMPKTSLTSLASDIAFKGENLTQALEDGTDNYLINQYIFNHFNNMTYMKDTDHFFRNEIEYILGGELSDEKNEKRVKMAIVAIRFPLNIEHIYSSPQKMEALLSMAEILAPEAPVATQLLLASTWAYAESDNDVELLWEGHKVPILKDDATWAVDFDSAIEGLQTGTFKPDQEKGYDYEKYLQFLLFFQDEELKTARIMDLIDINTRMNSDSDFVISEHCTGMNISVKINGKAYNYDKKY